jgi:hypothetical protein
MTDEEFEQKQAFIVETLARVSVNDEKHDLRIGRLERVMKLIIRAGLRERKTRSEADERLTKALVDLADAQRRTEESIVHTDRRLDALIDFVRQQQNGRSHS